MHGLGNPNFNTSSTSTTTSSNDSDKLLELEARIEKLEKTLGWMKWVIAFIGLFILTNKNNEN